MTDQFPVAPTDRNWQQTNCYATAVRRADRALNRVYDQALRPTGLTTTQFSLLSLIERAPAEITLSDLATAQVMDRTTISRNLTQLQKANLVQIRSGADKRRRYVHLTDTGHEAVQQGRPLWREAQHLVENDHGLVRMTALIAELSELSRLRIESPEDTDR